MKVKLVKTGETTEYNDSYGLRLIEQGKAVPAASEPFPMNPPEAAPEGEPEEPKTETKKSRKG